VPTNTILPKPADPSREAAPAARTDAAELPGKSDAAGPTGRDDAQPAIRRSSSSRTSQASKRELWLYEVEVDKKWIQISEKDSAQIEKGVRDHEAKFLLRTRSTVYEIDALSMTQTNVKTKKVRRIRRVGGDEEPDPEALLLEEDREPEWDAFEAERPVWSWLDDKDVWRDFDPQDSAKVDRYYRAYKKRPDKYILQVKLAKSIEVQIDFRILMQCMKSTGRRRRIRRQMRADGFPENKVFFEVFSKFMEETDGVNPGEDLKEVFDWKNNQDFRNIKDDGRKLQRGGRVYRIPCGWKRIAINVRGKYDNGDDSWIGEGADGWAVAYHGTQGEHLPAILSTGFKIGPRQRFKDECGEGIYTTFDLEVAQRYCNPLECNDCEDGSVRDVQVVLQLRVRPSAIKEVKKTWSKIEQTYWVINDPDDIRAYGVLVREVPQEKGCCSTM